MHQPGVQFGIGSPPAGAPHQPQHGILGAPEIGFERGVQVMRDRQIRIQFERLPERKLGTLQIVPDLFERPRLEFCRQPVAAPKARPRRRESRILAHALDQQIPRDGPPLGVVEMTVAAQVQFVRSRTGGRVTLEDFLLARREGFDQRIGNPLAQLVLYANQIVKWDLDPVRPEDRSVRHGCRRASIGPCRGCIRPDSCIRAVSTEAVEVQPLDLDELVRLRNRTLVVTPVEEPRPDNVRAGVFRSRGSSHP